MLAGEHAWRLVLGMTKKRKDWHWYEERDVRIRQMHNAGIPTEKIGRSFGISAKGVHAVLKRLQAEEKAVQRSAELLKEFCFTDDLDRKWKVEVLMDALQLPTRARTAIGYRFEWKNITELSLRELMDIVIPDTPHPTKPGYLMTQMLDLRNVRGHTFWLTVKRLTDADLGMRCNLEWKRRLGRLMDVSRVVGSSGHGWSIPCEPPDWLRAQETP